MIVQCDLCPKYCVVKPGESGDCRIRVNFDGRLTAVTHGFACSVHVDPIEKKPFFHFLPGSPILSIATAGCNLHCKNCQNWEISQCNPEDLPAYDLPPGKVPAEAKKRRCPSVAYTYTEPLVYYAAPLKHAAHPAGAARFAAWLSGDSAQAIFRRFGYDPAGAAGELRA